MSNQKPVTQAERDQWEAIRAEFDWANDEWAAATLPWIRLAAVLLRGDQDRLKELMCELMRAGEASNALEGLRRTRSHLDALHQLLDTALLRLEGLGYPDNPPNIRLQ